MGDVTEMEMRVAMAIWAARDADFPKFTRQTWAQGTLLAQESTLKLARAAIKAMNEDSVPIPVAAQGAQVISPTFTATDGAKAGVPTFVVRVLASRHRPCAV